MRPRTLVALIFITLLVLTLVAGGMGLALQAKRARSWPRRFAGVSSGLPFTQPTNMMCAALSPDGKTLLTGNGDGTIEGWDIAAYHKKFGVNVPGGNILSASYSPDGSLFAAGSGGQICLAVLKDAQTGAVRREWGNLNLPVYSVAFSPNGKLLAAGSDRIDVWEVQNGTVVWKQTGHYSYVWGVAFSPDGKILASAGDDGIIRLRSALTGKLIKQWQAYHSRACAVAFSPDGKSLATVGKDNASSGSVKLWDVATRKMRLQTPAEDLWAHSVSYLPDGRLAYSPQAGQLALLSPTGDTHLVNGNDDLKQPFNSIDASQDGTKIAVACVGGTALVWTVPAPGQPATP
jgi:WD40 repeat protein